MKEEDIQVLVNHRLQQAEESLGDAKFLLDGQRSQRSVIIVLITLCFMLRLPFCKKLAKFLESIAA